MMEDVSADFVVGMQSSSVLELLFHWLMIPSPGDLTRVDTGLPFEELSIMEAVLKEWSVFLSRVPYSHQEA